MIESIERYYELKMQKKAIEEEMDKLNKEIKRYMVVNIKKDYLLINGYKVRIYYADFRKFSDDIIPYLMANGYGSLIETKQVFDYEKLKRLIKNGKIDKSELDKFRSEKGKKSMNLYVDKLDKK